jgi:hypothetical protein
MPGMIPTLTRLAGPATVVARWTWPSTDRPVQDVAAR